MSLTESAPHLVPVMTRPGSRVSPCASSSPCPTLYTCVPIHWIFLLPTLTVVSMRTALFSMGLEAEAKHWIFPHLASLAEITKTVSSGCLDCLDLLEYMNLNVFDLHLSLQLLYFPNRSLPQFPYMSPASFTFLKHRSGAARPSAGQRR